MMEQSGSFLTGHCLRLFFLTGEAGKFHSTSTGELLIEVEDALSRIASASANLRLSFVP